MKIHLCNIQNLSYTHSSMLFSAAFTLTWQILSFFFSALDRYGCTVTLTIPLLHPKALVPDGLLHPDGLLPRANLEKPSPSCLPMSAPQTHFEIPLPTAAIKLQPWKVLQPQTPCATHAFSCSPEVHSCQAAACSSVISGPRY